MDSRTSRPAPHVRRAPHAPHARGFSLIELLIVVGIIVILISISLAVGFKVSGNGKVRQTEQTLRTLDLSLTELISGLSGANPKPYVLDPRPANMAQPNPANQFVQPVIDGVNDADGSVINSVALYIAQCREVPAAFATIQTIPPKILKEFDGDANGNDSDRRGQVSLLTALDGWGNPIRYVHPAFAGVHPLGQVFDPSPANNGILKSPPIVNSQQRTFGIDAVRRNDRIPTGSTNPPVPDSDGGFTPGNRPYFYSAGPDGKVGYEVDGSGEVVKDYNEDNIYLNQPTYSKQ